MPLVELVFNFPETAAEECPTSNPSPNCFHFHPTGSGPLIIPNNVINEGVLLSGCEGKFYHALDQPVFPTPFYESLICSLFFLELWFIRGKITIPGMLFSIYLILNGIERFIIGSIRVNIKYKFMFFETTQAQPIAIGLIILGIIGIIFFNKLYKKQTAT